MSNSFNKEEIVAFEDMLEGFEDQLAMMNTVSVYRAPDTLMERTGDVIWRPQPYISQSFDGMDQTANFQDHTQLAVPATIGYAKSVPWTMNANELRDALQEGRLYESAKQRLSSDINRAVLDVTVLQGSLVVKRSTAATGFDDIALAEAIMNEQGVPMEDRKIVLNTRDYNGMASNLASRQTLQGKTQEAYNKAYLGQVAGFDTYKLDYSKRIGAATASGITISTLDAATNYYVPKATSTAATGERNNVDNRFQRVTVSATTNIKAGDAFTIAGVDAVHHITKDDTGQLKTFRVISVDSGTTMTICPPIISNQVVSSAAAQYKNVEVVTKAANSAIVFLNTVTAQANAFWQKDAIEIIPGRYVVPSDAGVARRTAATSKGIELQMLKWVDGNTLTVKYRVDCKFGVVNKQPEMSGIMLFNQT